MKYNNCIDCSAHIVLPDPDPNDWFCDDDVKVVCGIENKNITVACRPYNIRKESIVPEWCPKSNKEKKENIKSVESQVFAWEYYQNKCKKENTINPYNFFNK